MRRPTPIPHDHPPEHPKRLPFTVRLRNYFLTGIVVAAPISITIYLVWSFISAVDVWVKPLIPARYNPDSYLPFTVPGFGLVVAVVALTVLGFLTANLVGRAFLRYGEMLVDRMPLVRPIYRALKQIFETVLTQRANSFQQVALLEFPRRGAWVVVFIATEAKGEIAARLPAEDGDDYVVCFMPTTPNPTSGFLMIVPKRDVIFLDMTVEDAAKLVISAGLVTPEFDAETLAAVRAQPAASNLAAESRSNR